MDTNTFNLTTLFAQLGLPNQRLDIASFIQTHQLPASVSIIDAPYWNIGQKAFLKEALAQDDPWSEVIDAFDAQLHKN